LRPRGLLERVAAGADDRELRHLAKAFEGDWPYLELLASAAGISDPLDARVVEAYWIGNPLLDKVDPSSMAGSMQHRFRVPAGRAWPALMDAVSAGALPHHSFHVLGVYPLLGLGPAAGAEEPLCVLDQCRIRWGQVVEIAGERAIIRSRPLCWDGRSLELGEPRLEEVVVARDGLALVSDLGVGDRCSLRWDWICDRITARQLRALQTYTLRQLRVINGLHFSMTAPVQR
jgi:hypothetical protein